MNDDTLERRLAVLRRSSEPDEDLWPRIEKVLGERGAAAARRASPGGWPARLAEAAARLRAPAWAGLGLAACLAAAAVVVVPRMLERRDDGSRAELLRELHAAEQDYRDARARLIGSLRAVADGYGQETVSLLERDLQVIDRLVAEVREAGGEGDDDWQPVYRLVELYRSHTAGIARADELVRSVSFREEPR